MTLKDLLQRWWCTQPHTRPAAIFIDEFHAGFLDGLANDMIVHPCERGCARHELGAVCGDADGAMVGEVVGAAQIKRGRRGFEG